MLLTKLGAVFRQPLQCLPKGKACRLLHFEDDLIQHTTSDVPRALCVFILADTVFILLSRARMPACTRKHNVFAIDIRRYPIITDMQTESGDMQKS